MFICRMKIVNRQTITSLVLKNSIRHLSAKPSYIHNIGEDPLKAQTLGRLLEETAKKYGDRTAIISSEQNNKLTFQEVLERADKLAAGLQTIGLNHGDRLGIWAPSSVEWYLTHMACARAGLILVCINPAFTANEMEYCINKVSIKGLVCLHKTKNQNYYDILEEISSNLSKSEPGMLKCPNIPSLKNVIVSAETTLNGSFNFQEVLDLAPLNKIKSIQENQDRIQPDDPFHIQFTSGTTGKPKAALQSHFQLNNNAFFVGKRAELNRKHHKICVQVPFFHVFGTVAAINAALNHGATLVVPTLGYNPDKSLDAIRDEKCSIIYGTPTMFVDLVHRQKERKEDIAPEIAMSGGSSCPPKLFKDMKESLKVKKIKSIYGLTETTAVVFQSLFDEDEFHSTSTVGYPQEHMELKVVDSKGRIVPRGTPGELLVRGYPIMLEYWEDEVKTKEAVQADRWLKTGDQFVINEDGYGRVVGRLKEMVIRGGENIFPKEIEDFLITHPDILEVHVVGVPHDRLGEEICACARLKPGKSLSLDDIKTFCKGKIAHFKVPKIFKVMESFPKTTSGKIQKFKIVEIVVKDKL